MLEIRYWDVRNFAGNSRTGDYGDWHHAVLGVEILTDCGPSCVQWTSAFELYGVEVFQTSMPERILGGESGPEAWDASESDRWQI